MSQVTLKKVNIVEETVESLIKYDVIAASDLYKVGSIMLQDLRKQLRGDMDIRCIKNTLMRRSLEKAGMKNWESFMDAIPGQNLFIFTNGNPFKLAMRLDRNKVKVFAKTGDTASDEIIIPSGNTGLAPGPIISNFGTLGIRTRIESGNIWVNQDSTVAKKGDEISKELADLLQRIGIRAAEMGLMIKAVYEEGNILLGETLILDIDDYRESLKKAISYAFQVAIEASYVTPLTLPSLLMLAYENAQKLAVEAGYVTNETIIKLITRAAAQATSLAIRVGKSQAK